MEGCLPWGCHICQEGPQLRETRVGTAQTGPLECVEGQGSQSGMGMNIISMSLPVESGCPEVLDTQRPHAHHMQT